MQRRRWATARVLVVGDSSVTDVAATAPQNSVAARLAAAHPDWTIGNLARNGSRTADVARMLCRLAARLDRYGSCSPVYDAVVIHTGGNDALRFTREGPLSVSLVIALAAGNRIARHTVLVTGGIQALAAFPPPWSWLFGWRGRRVRALFQAIAWEAGVLYVDLHGDADEDPTEGRGDHDVAADGVHPSDDDYAPWFEPVDEALTRRIGFRPGRSAIAATAMRRPPAASVLQWQRP